MKFLLFIAIVILVSVGVAYACDYNFCSPAACDCDGSCKDSCYGGYWYSNGVCKDCFSDGSKHCSFEARTCSKSCGAQCGQSSDCTCQNSGCVGKDYYTYAGTCNEGCTCVCTPTISPNDAKCPVCDASNVNCQDPACYGNPTCSACDPGNLDCNNPACASSLPCLPCDTNNVNCTIPSCSGNPACAPCDSNNVNCSLQSCSGNNACLPCDPVNVNCNLPACSGNSACAPQPVVSGGGSIIISGSGPEQPVKRPAVCGDGICSDGENCSGCPKDCLKNGEKCCSEIARTGNCCTDYDCGKGYMCNITNLCQQNAIKVNISIGCKEDWICTGMSNCKEDTQKRFCVDKNDCGTINEMPDLVQSCSSETPSGMFLLPDPALLGAIVSSALFVLFLILRRRKSSESLKMIKTEGKSEISSLPPETTASHPS
jgi:hypothetical protein